MDFVFACLKQYGGTDQGGLCWFYSVLLVFIAFGFERAQVSAYSCNGFAVFQNSRARGVLGFFEILGVPEGSFLIQLQRFWCFQGSLEP